MREEFKASFFSKYILHWGGLGVLIFALWIVIFRSTVSVGWKTGTAIVLIFLIGNGVRWIIKLHKDFCYRVIVTDESLTGELFNKNLIEIRWDEIKEIVEEPAIFTLDIYIYSKESGKRIWVSGLELLNFDALEEIIRQKIKEYNIPHKKISRLI